MSPAPFSGASGFGAFYALHLLRGSQRQRLQDSGWPSCWFGAGFAYLGTVLLDATSAQRGLDTLASVGAVGVIAALALGAASLAGRGVSYLPSIAVGTLVATDLVMVTLLPHRLASLLSALATLTLGLSVALALRRTTHIGARRFSTTRLMRLFAAAATALPPLVALAIVDQQQWILAGAMNVGTALLVSSAVANFEPQLRAFGTGGDRHLKARLGWFTLAVLSTVIGWVSARGTPTITVQVLTLLTTAASLSLAFKLISSDFEVVMRLESFTGGDAESRAALSSRSRPYYIRLIAVAATLILSFASWMAGSITPWQAAGMSQFEAWYLVPLMLGLGCFAWVLVETWGGLSGTKEAAATRRPLVIAVVGCLLCLGSGLTATTALSDLSSWRGSLGWHAVFAVLVSLFAANAVLGASAWLQDRRAQGRHFGGAVLAAVTALVLMESASIQSTVNLPDGAVTLQASWLIYGLHMGAVSSAVAAIAGGVFLTQGQASNTLRGAGAGIYQDAAMCALLGLLCAWPVLVALGAAAQQERDLTALLAATFLAIGPQLLFAGLVLDWLMANNDSHVGREWTRRVGGDIPDWARPHAGRVLRFRSLPQRITAGIHVGDNLETRYMQALSRHTAIQNLVGHATAVFTIIGLWPGRGQLD